jgi:hypothetical protein
MNAWSARINANGMTYQLGFFEHEVDAARAYNEAAIRFKKDTLNVLPELQQTQRK